MRGRLKQNKQLRYNYCKVGGGKIVSFTLLKRMPTHKSKLIQTIIGKFISICDDLSYVTYIYKYV